MNIKLGLIMTKCREVDDWEDFLEFQEFMAERFGGIYWNSGGNCMLTSIQVDEAHELVISEDSVILFNGTLEENSDDYKILMNF